MRVSDIVELAKQYLFLGILAAALAVFIFTAGYFIIYKKVLKGEKILNIGKVIWFALFLCYLVIISGATMLSRGSGWENSEIIPLFYSYREAWNSFSVIAWRNIILNIILFIPFGFLLPIGIQRFRRFWKIYLAGLCFTILIEGMQLILKKGIFEMDDIFNNLLGTMIGYGCFAIVKWIGSRSKKEQVSRGKAVALQIPLLGTVIMFSMIFTIYGKQELGNLECNYISRYDTDLLDISAKASYSENAEKEEVYKISPATIDETRKQAEDFFELLGTGLDESRTDLYENTAVYYNTDGNSLWIEYTGGIYSYTDYDVVFGEDKIETEPQADEGEIRKALKSYGIDVPTEAVFENLGEGNYQFTVEEYRTEDVMHDGTLTCSYYENGRFGDIRNHILICEKYKEFSVLSEKEAYEQICGGRFRWYSNEKLEIVLGKVKLRYVIDSKGFYQPVYMFKAVVNDSDAEIIVPAIL